IPTNAELTTALGTADDAVLAAVAAAKSVIDNIHDTDLPAVKTETAAIKAKTDNLPATPASAGEYTAAIAALQADLDNPDQYKANITTLATTTDMTDLKERIDAVDTIADAILEDTGTTIPATLATIAGYTDGIAGDVWSYKVRTLTNSLTSTTEPASGDPISLFRYATNNISFSDLGVMTGRTKLWITFKENNDQADAMAIMQVEETAGLVVLNGSATLPAGITTAEVSITVDDASTGSITIRIDQLVANVLSTYEAYPIYFDIKQLISDDVNLLYQGEAYIYATSTQTIS
ncbi:MAG TPA: hypothetical protein PL124_12425, partial [Candidatus Cloacimonadota bacterium]|nr:hypothetical protein [Candidatus Cloacimonadota bacterium]